MLKLLGTKFLQSLQFPSDPTARNIRYLYMEIGFASLLSAMIAFNSAYAIRLGASKEVNALLYSAPALLSAVASIPLARFLASRRNRNFWLFGALIVFRMGYILAALTPFIFWQNPAAWFVGIVVILWLPLTLFSNGWQVLLGEVIPENQRGFVISRRQIIWSIGALLFSIVGSVWLGRVSFPTNYAAMYLTGVVIASFSTYIIMRKIAAPKQAAISEPVPTVVRSEETVRMRKPIRRMLIGMATYQFGLALPAALFVPYYINDLQATDSWMASNNAIASLGVILGYLFWERRLRQHNFGWVQRRASLWTWLFPVGLAMSKTLGPIMLINFIVNMMHAGVELANFNVLLQIARPHERVAYISWYNTVIQAGTFLAPLIGTLLASQFGIVGALLFSGAIRFLGALLFNVQPVDYEIAQETKPA